MGGVLLNDGDSDCILGLSVRLCIFPTILLDVALFPLNSKLDVMQMGQS